MSTPVKICIYIVSILVIIAVALTVLVKTQITPEKVRENLLPLAEKKLQRRVEFGKIKIGVFSGISLADLTVMQKNSEEEFFSVQAVELHYRLLPLLMGKIAIDQILFQHPKIFVTRMPDGQFNYSDLLPRSSGGGKKSTKSNSNSLELPALDLLIKEVSIKDGELFYIDKFKNSRSPFRYTLDKLNFRARQITFDSPFPVDLSAVVNGSNIDISGNYDLARKIGDLEIHLAPLDMMPFAPYYRTAFPGKLSSAQLSLELELDISPDLIASKGKLTLDDVDLVLDKLPELNIKQAKLDAAYAFNYDTKKQLLKVSTLLLDFNKIKLGAEGELDLSTTDPYMVSTLFLKGLDLREMMQNLPESLTREYQKYSFAGSIDGQIDFSGKLDSGIALVRSVKLKLSEIRASVENLRAGVSGDIAYADDTLATKNLFLQYGDQKVQLKAKVKKGSDKIFRGAFKLSADTLDINKVLGGSESQPEPRPESESIENDRGDKGAGVAKVTRRKTLADDVGPFDIPIDMRGTLAVKRLIYKKLKIDKITADLNLKDNNLSVMNLVGQINKGELKGNSRIDLGIKGLSYQGEMSLQQPNIGTLISGLFPEVKQSVTGSLRWQNNFSGRGTLADTLLPALKLKGFAKIKKGTAKGFPILDQLAGFLGSSQLKAIRFQSLNAQYDLSDGLTRVNGNLDSSKTKFTTSGTIDIGGYLNLNLGAHFAPDVLKKLGLKKSLRKAISDQDGWGTLPLQVQGTVDDPDISYDTESLEGQLVEKASQKLLEKIEQKGDGETEPIKKMLDNTLNKLFGK